MNLEQLKQGFFKEFGESSFRGYPLQQCNEIWEFFEKRLNSLDSLKNTPEAEWHKQKQIVFKGPVPPDIDNLVINHLKKLDLESEKWTYLGKALELLKSRVVLSP